MATKMKKKTAKRKNETATAFHLKHKDGIHNVVGIGNLRVVIVPDGKFWFAQGLEIDYAAQGISIADAKKNFSDGLCCTIHENLRVHDSITSMMKPAPAQVWSDLLFTKAAKLKVYSQESIHHVLKGKSTDEHFARLPFQGVSFLELQDQ